MEKKYRSLYSNHDVTVAQYLAEIMCIRLAAKNKEKLPFQFWNVPKWRVPFKQQIIAANALLKIYEPDEIIAAVNRKDASWIFSLRFPGLNQMILEEKDRLDKQKASLAAAPVVQYDETKTEKLPAKPFGNKPNMRKLDE